jgi:DNA-binding NarL/FixJ family response regulator
VIDRIWYLRRRREQRGRQRVQHTRLKRSEELQRTEELWRSGRSIGEIARQLGRSHETIRQRVRKLEEGKPCA